MPLNKQISRDSEGLNVTEPELKSVKCKSRAPFPTPHRILEGFFKYRLFHFSPLCSFHDHEAPDFLSEDTRFCLFLS